MFFSLKWNSGKGNANMRADKMKNTACFNLFSLRFNRLIPYHRRNIHVCCSNSGLYGEATCRNLFQSFLNKTRWIILSQSTGICNIFP